MTIKKFKHKNVLEDGTFSHIVGAVETKGKIVMSEPEGGCGLKNCNCSEGHWLSIILPRAKDGIVEGIKIKFDNKKEMEHFFTNRELTGK